MPVYVNSQSADDVLMGTFLRLKARHAPENPVQSRYRLDPVSWVREKLGMNPYPKQQAILQAVADHPRVAVVGANGMGKDYTSGRIVLWWQSTHKPAKTVVIGPSHRQVSDVVWRETRSAFNTARAPLLGHMLSSAARWEQGDDQFAVGFATNDPYNIQGFHSPNLLVIITEAHNVPQPHIDAIKRLNPTRMLLTGNPFASAGEFFDAFNTKADMYHSIHISGMDSPNVIEGREVVPGLLTLEQIETAKRDWGEESPMFRAYAYGEFADSDEGVVPLSWAVACRDLPLNGYVPNELGVDVGAGGDDTSIRHRLGRRAGRKWSGKTPNPEDACSMVVQAIDATGATKVKVDEIGVGWALVGMIRRERPGVDVVGVNVAEKSTDSMFPILRDQLWWEVGRELSRTQAWDLTECDAATIAQLTAPTFKRTLGNQIKIESKSETKKRLSRSPDDADALLLAFYEAPGIGVWSL